MPLVRPKLFRTSRGFFDVLAAVEPCSSDLQWYCVELHPGFFCSLNSDSDEVRDQAVRDVCAEIEKSSSGVPLPLDRMKFLASNLRREDMALFIAAKTEVPPPSWPLNVASVSYEITIQTAEDQSLYIMTRSESVAARLRQSLEASELLPETAPKPGSHATM